MLPFTIIFIIALLILLGTTIPRVMLVYRYTRPKIRPIKTMLVWEATLVALLLIGIVISQLSHQGCAITPPALTTGHPRCVSGTIKIGGSTALQTLMNKEAESYHQWCPDATINVLNSTKQNAITKSEEGLDSVEDGSITIGTSDTYAPSDKSDLVDHQIAASVFVVIVNSGVQVTNLTSDQIKGIYAGRYTNWHQLGGLNLTIQPLSRGSGSGTRSTFDTYILNAAELVTQSSPILDTLSMIENVRTTPGAIGYADLYDVYTHMQSLTPVTIDGIPASPFTVVNNTYKFWTIEHMYTKGAATGLAQAFIDYMNNEYGEQIMRASSFIVLHDMSSAALSSRCAGNGA